MKVPIVNITKKKKKGPNEFVGQVKQQESLESANAKNIDAAIRKKLKISQEISRNKWESLDQRSGKRKVQNNWKNWKQKRNAEISAKATPNEYLKCKMVISNFPITKITFKKWDKESIAKE